MNADFHDFSYATLQVNANHTGINLLRYVSRSVGVNEITSWRDTVILLRRETLEFIPQRCGHPIRRIWIRWTTASWVFFKRGSCGLPFADPWRERVERMSAECGVSGGWWTSGVVVWAHVFVWMADIFNMNLEPMTFWCVFFVLSILVSVNLVDINMCKVLILREMCYFCDWDF